MLALECTYCSAALAGVISFQDRGTFLCGRLASECPCLLDRPCLSSWAAGPPAYHGV